MFNEIATHLSGARKDRQGKGFCSLNRDLGPLPEWVLLSLVVQCYPLGWDLTHLFKADQAKTQREIRKLFDNFEADVKELLPGLEERCQWMVRQAAVYNIASTPGLVGKGWPGMHPPGTENLYLVTDTLHRVPGRLGSQALGYLALRCVEDILKKG